MNTREKKNGRTASVTRRINSLKREIVIKGDVFVPGALINANKARLEKIKAKSKTNVGRK